MDPIVTTLVPGREAADCVVASLAMYLNLTYEDVLRVVSLVDKEHAGKIGLWIPQIKKAAKKLGQPLKLKKKFNWDEDYGLLLTSDHCTVLRNGLIIDPDKTVWEWEDFLEHYKYSLLDVEGLLVAMPTSPETLPVQRRKSPQRTNGSRPVRRKKDAGRGI